MAKKLLIVDQAPSVRQLARRATATPQDTVLECTSPDEALKAVASFQPDWVLMGVTQPVPGAFQAIRNIRETYPRVRVVAISEVHETQLQEMAAEAGATNYVHAEDISELFLLATPLVAKRVKPARKPQPRRPRK